MQYTTIHITIHYGHSNKCAKKQQSQMINNIWKLEWIPIIHLIISVNSNLFYLHTLPMKLSEFFSDDPSALNAFSNVFFTSLIAFLHSSVNFRYIKLYIFSEISTLVIGFLSHKLSLIFQSSTTNFRLVNWSVSKGKQSKGTSHQMASRIEFSHNESRILRLLGESTLVFWQH